MEMDCTHEVFIELKFVTKISEHQFYLFIRISEEFNKGIIWYDGKTLLEKKINITFFASE